MPPKRVVVERGAAPRPRAPKGYFASAYETLTSSENAAVVTSIAAFGVGVAFLSSSFAEYLLPPP